MTTAIQDIIDAHQGGRITWPQCRASLVGFPYKEDPAYAAVQDILTDDVQLHRDSFAQVTVAWHAGKLSDEQYANVYRAVHPKRKRQSRGRG